MLTRIWYGRVSQGGMTPEVVGISGAANTTSFCFWVFLGEVVVDMRRFLAGRASVIKWSSWTASDTFRRDGGFAGIDVCFQSLDRRDRRGGPVGEVGDVREVEAGEEGVERSLSVSVSVELSS